jgi:hypothetical protein
MIFEANNTTGKMVDYRKIAVPKPAISKRKELARISS